MAKKNNNEAYMQERDIEKVTTKQKIGKILVTILIYTFLTIIALSVLFPFYWMLSSSLKEVDEYRANIPTLFPHVLDFHNYVEAFEKANLGRLFLNTLYVGVVSTVLSLVITVISAFAFARLEFKGKNILFAALLATMMIPGELFTVTNFITVYRFKWTSTYIVLIVPFLVSVYYIYLLRQNFKQIPNELYLAAKVDGKSDWNYLWKVMVPLAAPTLISIVILKFMGTWNSYVWPNLVTNNSDFRLISSGLRGSAFKDIDTGEVEYGYQMAATVAVTVPLFLLFVFFRKYIMKGVGRAGIKG